MSSDLKIKLFISTVESVLLYGSEAWTLTKALENSLNRTCTRMPRRVKGVSDAQKIKKTVLYGGMPLLTEETQARRLRLVGHLLRHDD